jgi:hypothetical protein
MLGILTELVVILVRTPLLLVWFGMKTGPDQTNKLTDFERPRRGLQDASNSPRRRPQEYPAQ